MMFNSVFTTNRRCFGQGNLKRCLSKSFSSSNTDYKNYPQKDLVYPASSQPRRSKFKTASKRCLSTVNVNVHSQPESMVSKDEVRQFTETFNDVVNDLTETVHHTNVADITGYYQKVLEYNVPHKNPSIGHHTVASYKILESAKNRTPENIRLANILGWCAELLASFFSINNDLMDLPETKNSRNSYTNDNVELQAITGSLMLENGLYSILKKHFSTLRCYASIIELFHEVSINTAMGQSLDAMAMRNGKPLLEYFTMSKYNCITKYRSSYLMFKLPVGLAMYLANMDDPAIHKKATSILLKLGQLSQIHNDVLDCFGNSAIADVNSYNICNGKCTWLIVEALHRANLAQRQLLEKNYGQAEPECEKVVKEVFKDLDLLSSYSVCNKLTMEVIGQEIGRLANKPLQKLCFKLMNQYDCTGKNLFVA